MTMPGRFDDRDRARCRPASSTLAPWMRGSAALCGHRSLRGWAIGLTLLVLAAPAVAENVNPAGDDARYAWGENVGWFNAQPLGPGGPGIEVHDFDLTGWFWGENIGWVSASCKNTASCDQVRYGVLNDGAGILSGEAWAENVGWILFNPTVPAGGAAMLPDSVAGGVGVTIDSASGQFDGTAWGENIGWINFSAGAAGTWGIATTWSCVPSPPPPSDVPSSMFIDDGSGLISYAWNVVNGATGHDVVTGDINTLRTTGGDFAAATQACLADNFTDTLLSGSPDPPLGEASWYFVRGVNCGGDGTYDSGGPGQGASRDAGLAGSAVACP